MSLLGNSMTAYDAGGNITIARVQTRLSWLSVKWRSEVLRSARPRAAVLNFRRESQEYRTGKPLTMWQLLQPAFVVEVWAARTVVFMAAGGLQAG